ncbi:ABC transporter transmembrane region [Ruminiclostridium papyrosolvens DSM 2782]|uniref:ABC transporter transmembrane region n=1 Tax=Ruminiclostridium papyrosolvens DSM 2782 TaxID=588581 RepID=F1TDY3_9FIRM|nr:ABC transporter ATP-binding protein [Ruminiclostridium papyrosolvens]EGD47429.1 ABC transporter transmembrane region [Ruminiclostridium papyrosolvens DSM 2782]WES34772.1 ABC transporter ATP-binding protein [Ruminiclostridium papyrosolvens DSM 2782]
MGSLKSLLKIIPFIKKYRLFFCIGIAGTILCSAVSVPIPYFIGYILDNVVEGSKSYKELYYYIGLIALLYVLRYAISFAAQYIFAKVSNEVTNEMRYSVISKVLDLPMSYLSNTEKGYIQSRIGECGNVSVVFSPSNIGLLLGLVDAVAAAIAMFSLNFKLALVTVILSPVFYFSSKASAGGFMKVTHQMMESNAVLNGECFEIINGIEDIKVLNGKENQLKRFKSKLDDLVKKSIKQSKSILVFIENITIANNMGTLIILLIAAILIIKGQFTIGLYTSFSLYIGRVFGASQGLATVGTTIKPACLSIERLYELLDMKGENEGKTEILESNIDSIKVENVSFRYNSNTKNVINSLNFEISKGEKVLLRGENGSGKSTLIKLLVGLYTPEEGKILFNDKDLSTINNKSLRDRIGIVSQSIFLFRGTVLDNILYGQNQKKREDVELLIKQLNLDSYIKRLPNGLDSEISQNTAGVSGGQAQVIAFVRAMLLNKDIVILDEPISNVDVETRDIVLNILKNNEFKGILIVVSHIVDNMEFINKVIEF